MQLLYHISPTSADWRPPTVHRSPPRQHPLIDRDGLTSGAFPSELGRAGEALGAQRGRQRRLGERQTHGVGDLLHVGGIDQEGCVALAPLAAPNPARQAARPARAAGLRLNVSEVGVLSDVCQTSTQIWQLGQAVPHAKQVIGR